MFTVKIIRPDGETQTFPLQIVKQSIMVGDAWEDCAGFLVPFEADEFLNDEYGGESIRYAFLEGEATRGCFEDANDDEVRWELLVNGVSCTHEEFSNSAWNSMKTNTFRVPSNLDHKYRGCGNGIVKIEKSKGMVLDFDYTDEKLRPLDDQNIVMCNDAGKIVREDDRTITYRANFSSYTICLY